MARAEGGAVLLDAVIALAILGSAGITLAATVGASLETARVAIATDAETSAAAGLMAVVSLWPRDDLDRHLGERRIGAWRLSVQRPTTVLYDVVVADSATGQPLLSTTLYRPSADARR